MIQLIEHSKIDFEKYDSCVNDSIFPTVYAQSWYLDIVTQKEWKALVLNDYQAVMPIPYARMKRSFWKKSLVQPPFCQQLGVYSTVELAQKEFDLLYDSFLELNPTTYLFNHSNNRFLMNKTNVRSRTNYILNLDDNYNALFANFSASKRQSVRKTLKKGLELKPLQVTDEFLEFHNNNVPNAQSLKIQSIQKNLLSTLFKKDLLQILGAFYQGEMVAVAVFVFFQNRIYYLNSASGDSGRKLLAMDFIIKSVIELNADSSNILDFEGSEIPGVAKFISSFGAKNEPFYAF